MGWVTSLKKSSGLAKNAVIFDITTKQLGRKAFAKLIPPAHLRISAGASVAVGGTRHSQASSVSLFASLKVGFS